LTEWKGILSKVSFGVDVGGTFTDFVVFNHETKKYSLGKRLSTPENPSKGILAGVQDLLELLNIPASAIEHVIHGTTMVANKIIERKGAKVGLISTEGFRDNLELGREQRYDMYDLFIRRAEPLVPRYLRRTVFERVDWEGNTLRPIKIDQLDAIGELFTKEGVQAVAISLMHSYRNPEHEQKIRDHLKRLYPDLYVSMSSEVSPEVREHQRTSTTVTNAYVQPVVDLYLNDLQQGFKDLGSKGTIYIMLSGGGVTTVDVATSVPVRMVESGPAAGAIAGSYYGKLRNEENVVSFDMGGTTAKICLINNNVPSTTSEIEVAREHRFKKGSGLILKVPSIEMIEIGAGGGSIAHLDSMGLLKIGPESAGADPGPVSYGLGGTSPTVTDADLVLGFLNPEYFLGGEMQLDITKAGEIIKQTIGDPLNLDAVQAAQGVNEVVNENMASAARVYAAEQGVDIRKYAMVAFGGAGPVHAYKVAKLLGIPRVICPLGAGVMSSVGMLVAPKSFDFVQSYISRVDSLDWDYLDNMYSGMESHAKDILTSAGVPISDIILTRSADMRYVGQGFEISVPIPEGSFKGGKSDQFTSAFNATYENLFKRYLTHVPVEAITWRLKASEPTPMPQLLFDIPTPETKNGRVKGTRPIYMSEKASFEDVPVYDRYALEPGFEFAGPALVEEKESTVYAGPDCKCTVDEQLNLIMEIVYK
jgi:N-methylhydantoinase A